MVADFNAVEYLSLRLYPAKAVNKARAEVSEGRIRDAAEDYVRGADIFERALRNLSPAALRALVDDEQELEAFQVQAHSQSQDNNRFFNRTDASADFAVWADKTTWSLDEAVALILGKEPKVVDWDRVRPLIPFSAFAERYADIRQHLYKAKSQGQLADPVRPLQFFRWANARGVTFPAELEALFDRLAEKVSAARRGRIRMCEDEQSNPCTEGPVPEATLANTVSGSAATQSGFKGTIIHLDRDEARQKSMRDRENARKGAADVFAAPDTVREDAQSLRMMVLAMAIGRYGYRPGKGRQSTVTDIGNDLKAAGFELPPGVVRNLLAEASAGFAKNEGAGHSAGTES